MQRGGVSGGRTFWRGDGGGERGAGARGLVDGTRRGQGEVLALRGDAALLGEGRGGWREKSSWGGRDGGVWGRAGASCPLGQHPACIQIPWVFIHSTPRRGSPHPQVPIQTLYSLRGCLRPPKPRVRPPPEHPHRLTAATASPHLLQPGRRFPPGAPQLRLGARLLLLLLGQHGGVLRARPAGI